jgi:hypothetical protein
MDLVQHLLETRSPLDLAKELAKVVRENVALRDRAHAAETELFWVKATERDAWEVRRIDAIFDLASKT